MNQYTELFSGAETKTKKCGMCLIEKPLGCFGKDSGAKYLRYECKDCARAQAQLVKKLKKSVAPPPKDHTCPICKKTEIEARGHNINNRQIWCADHDHTTNKFRGWICHKCNLGLGNFADNKERLLAAKNYLENHERRH